MSRDQNNSSERGDCRQLASQDSEVPQDDPWQEIAKQVIDEKDPVRMLELSRKLDEVMVAEERQKVLQRFEVKRRLHQSAEDKGPLSTS